MDAKRYKLTFPCGTLRFLVPVGGGGREGSTSARLPLYPLYYGTAHVRRVLREHQHLHASDMSRSGRPFFPGETSQLAPIISNPQRSTLELCVFPKPWTSARRWSCICTAVARWNPQKYLLRLSRASHYQPHHHHHHHHHPPCWSCLVPCRYGPPATSPEPTASLSQPLRARVCTSFALSSRLLLTLGNPPEDFAASLLLQWSHCICLPSRAPGSQQGRSHLLQTTRRVFLCPCPATVGNGQKR